MLRFEIELNNLTDDILEKKKRKSLMKSRLNKLNRTRQKDFLINYLLRIYYYLILAQILLIKNYFI